MTFLLTAEQESIRDTARRFFRARAPVAHLRHLRDTDDATGFSREVWRAMAELGLVGVALPAEHGGAGLGFAELGLVLEEQGRNLAPTPLVSTVLLGAGAILHGGSPAQRAEVLPAVAAGERVLALAHEEGTRHAPYRVRTTAARTGEGFRISGEKVLVLDGHAADALVVVARTSGGVADRHGLTLFLVPAAAAGLKAVRTPLVDSRGAARVRFDGVAVGRADVVGEIDCGAGILDALLDRAAIGLASEMLGSLVEAFERTVAYLKERRQFGVPIGSFQALKHRAAHLFAEIENTRSVVLAALTALDEGVADAPQLASLAKAKANLTLNLASSEGIQMHGGIGMTDEHEIGFFLKRSRVAEITFGSTGFHRDRYAALNGY